MKISTMKKSAVAFAILGLTVAPVRNANADETTDLLDKVVGYYTSAWGYAKMFLDFFAESGPDLAQKLDEVQRQILLRLATDRNQLWRTDATTVLGNYVILGTNSSLDPSNVDLWSSTLALSKTTINHYAIMVEEVSNGVSNDIESNYQLAPTFNSLVAAHLGLNKLKAELPVQDGWGTTWLETNMYSVRAMGVNYLLVGSLNYMCHPGFNPGAGHYIGLFAFRGHDPRTRDAQGRSQFFKKLASRDVQVGSWTGSVWGGRECNVLTVQTFAKLCNPGKGTCTPIYNSPLNSQLRCPGPVLQWPLTAAEKEEGLINARNQAGSAWFDPDPVVQLVNAAEKNILSTGGGTVDDNNSITLGVTGKLTDPHVYEPACDAISGGQTSEAYPLIATSVLPEPVSFINGFLQQSDERNIFPDNQLRIGPQSASKIGRSDPLSTPPNAKLILVLRYLQPWGADGLVRVGLQRHDNGGTQMVKNSVTFTPTGGPNQWKLMRLYFATNSSFDPTSYARLEYLGGQPTYFDAAWIERQ